MLLEIKSASGGDRKSAKSKSPPRGVLIGQNSLRQQAAADAGLTPQQAKTAVEVAEVEKQVADEMICPEHRLSKSKSGKLRQPATRREVFEAIKRAKLAR